MVEQAAVLGDGLLAWTGQVGSRQAHPQRQVQVEPARHAPALGSFLFLVASDQGDMNSHVEAAVSFQGPRSAGQIR